MKQTTTHWLAGLALAFLGAGPCLFAQGPPTGGAPPSYGPPRAAVTTPRAAPAGALLQYSRNVPGDAKPIVVEADQATTWNEHGRVVLLLAGRVLIQQGVVQCRFQNGAVWVDLNAKQATGVLKVGIYGEGQALLDTSSEVKNGPRLVAELHTRGEFKLRTPRGQVQGQDRSRDPLVARAREAGLGAPPAAPAIRPTSGTGTGPPPGALPEVPGALPAVPGASPPRPVGAVVPAGGHDARYAIHVEARPDAPSSLVRAVATTESSPLPAPGPSTPRRTVPPIAVPTSPSVLLPPPPARGGQEPTPLAPPQGGRPSPPTEADPAPAPAPGPPAVDPAPVPGPPSSSRQVPVPPQPQPPLRPAPTPGQAPPTPPNIRTPRRSGGLEYRIGPRTGTENWDSDSVRLDDGRWLITVSRGVVLSIRGLAEIGSIEVQADRAVIWTRPSNNAQPRRTPQGTSEPASDLEFYMSGHVVLRTQRPKTKDKVVIDADEFYYDTRRSVAIAFKARMELHPNLASMSGTPGGAASVLPGQPGAGTMPARVMATEPIVITADQLFQTSSTTYEVINSEVFSSKLPSDPGLKLTLAHATLEERRVPRYNIFGQRVVDKNGKPLEVAQSILHAENVVGTVENVPFLYLPYLACDARDPLGPLENIRLGGNNIFGFETGVTLNVYKMLGILPLEGTRWKLYPDYMSKRGPSLGTLFSYTGKLYEPTPEEARFFPDKVQAGEYLGNIRLWGIYDQGRDNLGPRPPELLTFNPPGFRGRSTWQHFTWDLPGGFDVIAGVSAFTDRNYLEQYFKREFDTDPNQATFVYAKHQDDFWAYSGLVQGRVNSWITTTEWFPRADGYLQGVSLFDSIISNTHATVGYARLRPSSDPIQDTAGAPPGTLPPPPFLQTTLPIDTGRAAVMQEFSLPLDAGPFRVTPYVKGMGAFYSSDLNGNQTGRVWGGAGVRANLPLSRVYNDAKSDLFNVDGLEHKVNFGLNYFIADTNKRYNSLPELDRLNDDATEQMLREMTPWQPLYNPGPGYALATSYLYDPQMFAIRRLVDNRFETLDHINVLQMEVRQRLQTRRGYPGSEHIVDWMSLDLSASYFPQPGRDNFGKSFSFLEYRYLCNIGDRTSFESTGWFDPQDDGPRVATFGVYMDRPDRTRFYLGYRQIDPLQSRMLTGAVTYIFSPKYAMTFSAAYDFGTSRALNNTLVFTRTGRDLSVSLGFTYNSLQNNFGLVFEIVPNLLGQGRGYGANNSLIGSGGGFGR